MQAWKIHNRFRSYWPEYKNKDINKVCKSIIDQMGIKNKKDNLTTIKNHWADVCNFLIKWEGRIP